MLTDSLVLAYYMTKRFTAIAAGMIVHTDRMLENLESSYGLVFSESVLLALVESGLAARRGVPHRPARTRPRTWEERRSVPRRAVRGPRRRRRS